MTSSDLSIGSALIPLLEAYGVECIFGIPGVHNVELYRGLPSSNIKHVLPRHEQGAGYMADGYARATGKPGVCFTITGPGLTNILTTIGQAYSDSVPLLVISSCLNITDNAHGRGRLHEMRNQRGAAASVAETAVTAFTARDVQDALAAAFASFNSARPRPHYIEIPIDVLLSPAGDHGWTPRQLPVLPHPCPDQIDIAAEWLNKAKSPLIIAGGGAVNAGPSLAKLAEVSAAKVITTIAGKGVIAADHPNNIGSIMPQPMAIDIIADSDLVLAVGTEIAETDLWNQPFQPKGKFIRIDIDPAMLARPHPADLAILADANASLSTLAAKVTNKSIDIADEVRSLRAKSLNNDDLRVMLSKVLATIRDNLPANTVIATDMTQIAYAANEVFPVSQPRSWLHPVGFGTLGYALPAAIGAKLALGSQPVAVLAGDYGFQFTINELGTAVEAGLNLPVLLWNNDALGQIRDDMVMKNIAPNAVSLINPDFSTLSKAYGVAYSKPASLAALAEDIKTALAADAPMMIEMTPAMVK